MTGRTLLQRRQSSYHYQTFPGVVPPSSRGRPPPLSKPNTNSPDTVGIGSGSSSLRSMRNDGNSGGGGGGDNSSGTPIPRRQLIILAVISLAEQTALNSVAPYLPEMAATFPEVDAGRVGLYVGIIASSFAAAQFATNVFWGRLSDRIGRKPVILLGTFLTGLCLLAFGFCRTLTQAIMVQVLMGLANGNAGVVSTVLGEITDKSNQTSAFAWLPIIYGLGAITGPIVGGLFANPAPNPNGPISHCFHKYPYLLPNVVSSGLLAVDFVMSFFMLDESLAEAQDMQPLGERVKCLFTWLWQFLASYWSSYLRVGRSGDGEVDDSSRESLAESCPALIPERGEEVSYHSILAPQIVYLLITYTLFNLSNIAFNSLYPIYASGSRPTGRELSPKEIGLLLSLSGAAGIAFQAFLFTPIDRRVGNVWCYRIAFLGFVIALFAMPLVDVKPSSPRALLWAQLGGALLIKSVAAVTGLTCAMLLVTNASPKPSTLGTLNGFLQTVSAAGRAIGPLASGALFTAGFQKKGGEWLPWGVFGGIAAVGLALSFALRWKELEGEDGEEATVLLGGERNGSRRGS